MIEFVARLSEVEQEKNNIVLQLSQQTKDNQTPVENLDEGKYSVVVVKDKNLTDLNKNF